jgi:preprotein translocase subunit SecY
MKTLVEKLREIWSIPELRTRILFTLGLLLVYRFGSFVILPGIDTQEIQRQMDSDGGGGPGLLDLLNTFSGGAFFNAAIFALGIMPYISASIIVQLLGFAVPYFQKLQRDGEAGQRRMNQITRYITIGITLVQGSAYLNYMYGAFPSAISVSLSVFWFSNIIILTSGTVFCMWLGERITDKGIGNGISLLITAGIIATLPQAFIREMGLKFSSMAGGPVIFVVELALFSLVVLVSVALVQAVRKIQIKFAKHMVGRSGGAGIATDDSGLDHIPIKLQAAGVMPIIFAQALMFIPGAIAQAFGAAADSTSIWGQLSDFTSIPYNIVFFLMVVIFTYVYTALIVNPQQQADYLKRQNAFIPNVKPGNDTAEYIDEITTRVTLPGSISLGLIAILPGVAAAAMMIDLGFAIFFGGTSLLIMVAVVLDTLQQIEGHLSMHSYGGLLKTGRVKGRERTKAPV